MRARLLCGLLALLPLPAAGAGTCGPESDQMTLDRCAGDAFQKADAELNAAYQQIRQRLRGDEATSKLLVGAQRAWITFRDAECEFATAGVAGGSIRPMVETECREAMTRTRVGELKAYLHCAEGDLSCPVPR